MTVIRPQSPVRRASTSNFLMNAPRVRLPRKTSSTAASAGVTRTATTTVRRFSAGVSGAPFMGYTLRRVYTPLPQNLVYLQGQ